MNIDVFAIYLHSVTCRVYFSEEDRRRAVENSVLTFLDQFKLLFSNFIMSTDRSNNFIHVLSKTLPVARQQRR